MQRRSNTSRLNLPAFWSLARASKATSPDFQAMSSPKEQQQTTQTPVSGATRSSSPVIAYTSPESRAHAHDCELGRLSVKELKQRLAALHVDVTGLLEKARCKT